MRNSNNKTDIQTPLLSDSRPDDIFRSFGTTSVRQSISERKHTLSLDTSLTPGQPPSSALLQPNSFRETLLSSVRKDQIQVGFGTKLLLAASGRKSDNTRRGSGKDNLKKKKSGLTKHLISEYIQDNKWLSLF